MKNTRLTFLMTTLLMLSCVLAFATPDSIMVAAGSTGTTIENTHAYTLTMLITLSLLGILVHWLVDLKKAQKQGICHSVWQYAKDTAVSSTLSFVICVAIILLRHEIASNIPTFTAWEGGAMFVAGLAGDSLLPLLFGFAKSKGIDISNSENTK